MRARGVRVKVERNLRGLRGRTNRPFAYLFGKSDDIFQKW